MAEILAGLTVPSVLNGAWQVLSTAYSLYSSVKSRREQVGILLSRCRILVEEMAKHAKTQPNTSQNMLLGIKRIEAYAYRLHIGEGSPRDLKAQAFCMVSLNHGEIDYLVQSSEGKIQDAFRLFEVSAHFHIAQFQSELKQAQTKDREDLSQQLHKLSQNDEQILQAIQDQNGVHRRMEELLVGILKYVQRINTQTKPRPEDVFLRDAAEMLCRRTGIKIDSKFAVHIISSFEIKFDVHRPIGSGSSGQVYRGEWVGVPVAIKRMHVDDARVISSADRKALRHEARIWSDLRHPNICTFYGACVEANVPFLVMQYCFYGDIRQFLKTNPDADRIKLSFEVASGLSFLHSRSIVHADIKGMNVLVARDKRALLTDFGLSLIMDDVRSKTSYAKDLDDKKRGTLHWMAPEVLSGASPDAAADVYSLSMIIWEIFSGQNPFNHIKPNILVHNVVEKQIRPERPARLSQLEIWTLMQKCWTPDPSSRPNAKYVVTVLKPLVSETATNDDKLEDDVLGLESSDSGIDAVTVKGLQRTKPMLMDEVSPVDYSWQKKQPDVPAESNPISYVTAVKQARRARADKLEADRCREKDVALPTLLPLSSLPTASSPSHSPLPSSAEFSPPSPPPFLPELLDPCFSLGDFSRADPPVTVGSTPSLRPSPPRPIFELPHSDYNPNFHREDNVAVGRSPSPCPSPPRPIFVLPHSDYSPNFHREDNVTVGRSPSPRSSPPRPIFVLPHSDYSPNFHREDNVVVGRSPSPRPSSPRPISVLPHSDYSSNFHREDSHAMVDIPLVRRAPPPPRLRDLL